MPTESEYGVTLGEYRKFLESMNDNIVNGLSDFADVLHNQSASLLDKSIAAERQIMRTYERMADLAAAAAHEARAEARAGFEAGERFWNNIADAANQKVGQMYGQLEGQRLTSALNDMAMPSSCTLSDSPVTSSMLPSTSMPSREATRTARSSKPCHGR